VARTSDARSTRDRISVRKVDKSKVADKCGTGLVLEEILRLQVPVSDTLVR
jgi:hypothetical protein